MKITPFTNNVIVKAIPNKAKIGSIFLPEDRAEEDYRYEVVAAGPDVKDLVVGDTVCIWPDAQKRPIDWKGQQLYRVNELDILYKETTKKTKP